MTSSANSLNTLLATVRNNSSIFTPKEEEALHLLLLVRNETNRATADGQDPALATQLQQVNDSMSRREQILNEHAMDAEVFAIFRPRQLTMQKECERIQRRLQR